MKEKIFGVLGAALLFGPLTAGATTITFSEAGATSNVSWFSTDGLYQIDWIWSLGLTDGHNHIQPLGGNPGAYEAGHGQDYQGVRITQVGGGAFSLDSFDMMGGWRVGTVHDPILGTTYLAPFGSWTTQSVSLIGSAIYIYASNLGVTTGAGSLDNININTISVPEPSTLALFGLGLLGAWLARQRKIH